MRDKKKMLLEFSLSFILFVHGNQAFNRDILVFVTVFCWNVKGKKWHNLRMLKHTSDWD